MSALKQDALIKSTTATCAVVDFVEKYNLLDVIKKIEAKRNKKFSENSKKRYIDTWQRWFNFLTEQGELTPKTYSIALMTGFLQHERNRGLRHATLIQQNAAIKLYFRQVAPSMLTEDTSVIKELLTRFKEDDLNAKQNGLIPDTFERRSASGAVRRIKKRNEAKAIPKETLKAIFDHPKANPSTKLMIALAYRGGGLRASEVLSIRWEHLRCVDDNIVFTLYDTKKGESREVILATLPENEKAACVVTMLKDHALKVLREQGFYIKNTAHVEFLKGFEHLEGWLFTNHKGELMDRGVPLYRLKKALAIIGCAESYDFDSIRAATRHNGKEENE